MSEMERGETRWRARGSSTELTAEMETAAAFVFTVPQTRARGRERMRASGRTDGRGLLAVDSGQWRQASHGAWRPRGSRSLLPVGHDRSELRVLVFIEID